VEAESIRRELPVVRVGCSLDCMIVVGSLGRTIVATVDIEVVGSTIAGEDSHRGRNVAVRRIRLDQDTPCCRARESDEWWRRGVLSTRSDDVVNRTVGARSCGLTRTAVCWTCRFADKASIRSEGPNDLDCLMSQVNKSRNRSM
jgi:hypothetical protein